MKKRNQNKSWLFIVGVVAYLATKLKALLPLLKAGKFGSVIISMVISIGAYAILFPIPFAIGFVLLLLVHELGHVIAAKQKGLPVSAPLFIPFLGALITMKKNPRDAATEAYIGIGGPILGSLGSALVFLVGWQFDLPLLLSIAYTGFFLNLINLLPIHPLDGGRISVAVTRWLWLVGLIGGLVVIIYMKAILFFIIWASFAWDLYKKYVKHRKNGESRVVSFDVLLQVGEEVPGYMIPGESHRRNLNFTTYSDLEGKQTVEFAWEALDLYEKIDLPVQGWIQRVHVTKIEHKPTDTSMNLIIGCAIEFNVIEDDKYYEVPVKTRWAFGTAYIGLAAFIIGMMYWIQKIGISYRY